MKVPQKRKTYAAVMIAMILGIWAILIAGIVLGFVFWTFVLFIVGLVISLAMAVVLSEYYYSGSKFICPDCLSLVTPTRGEFMRSIHVKHGRRFSCPDCGKKVTCIEV